MCRRRAGENSLKLCVHSKTAPYRLRYRLLTPRNGRRKFLHPVQIPSLVFVGASLQPSPSSSLAHSRFPSLRRCGTSRRLRRPGRAAGEEEDERGKDLLEEALELRASSKQGLG